jgi:lysophospholipase L1-like esterase
MLKLKNDGVTTLSADINSSVTRIEVTDGSVFPELVNASDWFPLTLIKDSNVERMRVTARAVNTLTVQRGAESTNAQAWVMGDNCNLNLTANAVDDMCSVTADYFLKDFEADLQGDATLEVDENIKILRKTSGIKDEFFVPISLSISEFKSNLPMGGKRIEGLPAPITNSEPATKSYADAVALVAEEYTDTKDEAQSVALAKRTAATYLHGDYEAELCGYFEVLIDDNLTIGWGVGLNGKHTFNGETESRLLGYESDLCGYHMMQVDSKRRVLTGVPIYKEPVVESEPDPEPIQLTLSENTSVNAKGDSVWLEITGENYAVKAHNSSTGMTVSIGSDNTNHDPVVDDSKRIIYVRDNIRYWRDISGSEEFAFKASNYLASFGDSMTAGGSGFSDIFSSSYPKYAISSQGIGGQKSHQIACRTGGSPLVGTLASNQIPASGPVAITDMTVSLVRDDGHHILVSIQGVEGRLLKADDSYTFTRTIAGGIVNTSVDEPVIVLSGGNETITLKELNGRINTIWMGRNDIGKSDYNQQTVLDLIAQAVSSQNAYNKKFLVLGITNGFNDITTGKIDVYLPQIKALNTALSSIYGDNFVEMISALKEQNPDYITVSTTGGIDYDVLNEVFSTDGTHGNAAGRTSVAKIIFDKLQSKGW